MLPTSGRVVKPKWHVTKSGAAQKEMKNPVSSRLFGFDFRVAGPFELSGE